ncbi:MAG: hypothetical protein AAF841_06275 [Pseudomonadota bacterium]
MPVFHTQKLLFIHIPKNAGKAVEDAFLQSGGDSRIGHRSFFNRAAKYLLNKTASSLPRTQLMGSYDYTFAAPHLTYAEIVKLGLLDRATLRALTPFSVVRNPFDRAASSIFHYFGAKIIKKEMAIEDADAFSRALATWLELEPGDHNEHAHRREQFDYVTLDGKTPALPHLLRYENLQQDLDAFCTLREIEKPSLKWVGRRREVRDLGALYNDEAKRLVERHFGRDLEEFGYQFP